MGARDCYVRPPCSFGPSWSITRGVELVRLSGALSAEHARALLDLCQGADASLRLDLEELISADGEGLEALRGLRRGGADLVGVSPYIALLLEGAPRDDRR